jgi:hypothetical protein
MNDTLSELRIYRKGREEGSIASDRSVLFTREQLDAKKVTLDIRRILSYTKKIKTHEQYLKLIKSNRYAREDLPPYYSNNLQLPPFTKECVYSLIKKLKNAKYNFRKKSSAGKKVLRFYYTRYADDFIILGNFPRVLAIKIRQDMMDWLMENLSAKLVLEKTKITNLEKESAKFLGFEIKGYKVKGLKYVIKDGTRTLQRTYGKDLFIGPDKQRLISRLHMKGYCSKKGEPIHMPWLAPLEPHILITRMNSVLIGMANFYCGYISYDYLISRWLWIISTSCIKTLANKYKVSVRKIWKKFGIRTKLGNSIQSTVTNTFSEYGKEIQMTKEWHLNTYKEILYKPGYKQRSQELLKRFNDIDYGRKLNKLKLPIYSSIVKTVPTVTNDSYLDKIAWLNLRTHASFDLPCSLCGSMSNINMHHIRHVRKTPFSELPNVKPWLKVMSLRNRKQIPVCRDCHMKKIHKGTYFGANLKTLRPIYEETYRGFDNRLINIESYLNPGNKIYSKTLEDKGWRVKTDSLLSR